MTTEGDRRAQGTDRIPFDALVEVGGAKGQPFEAQAINVSEDGMQLRTAYLPELGQPITCRFDAGPGESVLASGEVVWAHQGGKGGEFGIRFTDMDPESIESLRRMCGISKDAPMQQPGLKVRLHIGGLNSPMRARVKAAQATELTVGSDLAFLQVGKELELEDAESGRRRPARIDGVEVEVDAGSHVPQLIVMLRYADEAGARAAVMSEPHAEEIHVEHEGTADAPGGQESRASAPPSESDMDRMKRASAGVKGAFTRGVAGIGPTFSTIAKRAKTTIALLAAKKDAALAEAQPRRTTAPAPGGGLHTSGRKVIRGDSMASASSIEEPVAVPKAKLTKRKLAIGGAVLAAIALTAFAMRSKHPSAVATADSAAMATATMTHPVGTMPIPTSMPMPLPPAAMNAAPMEDEAMPLPDPTASDKAHKGKPGKVTPFGNGVVTHGNILHLKMDGVIESIEGAQQPTGFTVHIPGRRALEAAGPLTARDSRIASVKVSNDPDGAELTLAFKDGVPNYQVRAKGDTLEIALAPMKSAVAKKDPKAAGKPGQKKKPATAKPDPH